MISLRTRFDIHRDLGQWSLVQYALGLGYTPGEENRFVQYLQGKRELTSEEASQILSRHQFTRRDDVLPDEIISELEQIVSQ